MKRQAGFTIVELVVVIALLGILAAVALPRFIDVTDDAKVGAVNGAAGAFRSAVALAQAQGIAKDVSSADITLKDGTVIGLSADGYPVGGTGTTSIAAAANAQCVTLWQGLIGTGTSIATAAATGIDWVAVATANTCTYTYYGGDTTSDNMSIAYLATDGSITVDDTP